MFQQNDRILPPEALGPDGLPLAYIYPLEEFWKDVTIRPFTKLYEVSTHGRVRRKGKDKVLKLLDHNGYRAVWLSTKLEGYAKPFKRRVKVHRLVALAFIPNPFKFATVNHPTGVKHFNHWLSLEWASQSYQNKHANAAGLRQNVNYAKGAEHGRARLNSDKVMRILGLKGRQSSAVTAKQFKVSPSTIRSIYQGHTWGWLTGIQKGSVA